MIVKSRFFFNMICILSGKNFRLCDFKKLNVPIVHINFFLMHSSRVEKFSILVNSFEEKGNRVWGREFWTWTKVSLFATRNANNITERTTRNINFQRAVAPSSDNKKLINKLQFINPCSCITLLYEQSDFFNL